ncbi:MAG: hypothetical protein A3D35_00590 [Candidatus Staskawiczbacteria bacterium RIFCSPHIGHO2_02_FULL_34_9]|uniref:Winged helix-turn-helix transcription repressor HrcA DNA-binding domain-containing protein n=1 Tax=Candidatus Staskawiczbacteria bacterium RIFCSPHIGHO2_02_FULL_34_9 TaxID=1802206 RepID=A0A1G2I396_9BACT|nr:MAG: hypothetical protein A3D35_00590 [Candidatus Staskawiczbacteria bacterium RIFCSPHIGHO2_02_FULL_34_9]
MLTNRQGTILNILIKEYIDKAEPVSSDLLKKKSGLDISPATIRNDLQDLTEMGYINQPHTSAGRIPTEKGYRYFIEITFSGRVDEFPDFIIKGVKEAKQRIDRELEMTRNMEKLLEGMNSMLDFDNFHRIEEEMMTDLFKILERSKTSYESNIDIMKKLLKDFEEF